MKSIRYLGLIIVFSLSTFSYAGELYHAIGSSPWMCSDKKILVEASFFPDINIDTLEKGHCLPFLPNSFEVIRFETFTVPLGVQKVAYCASRLPNSQPYYFYAMQSDIEKVPDSAAKSSAKTQPERIAKQEGSTIPVPPPASKKGGELYLQRETPVCHEYQDLIAYFRLISEKNLPEAEKLLTAPDDRAPRCGMFSNDIPVRIVKKVNPYIARISFMGNINYAQLNRISDKTQSVKKTKQTERVASASTDAADNSAYTASGTVVCSKYQELIDFLQFASEGNMIEMRNLLNQTGMFSTSFKGCQLFQSRIKVRIIRLENSFIARVEVNEITFGYTPLRYLNDANGKPLQVIK